MQVSGKAVEGKCVLPYIEARSRNHCCSGKEITITYSEYVSVALVIQHAVRMRRIIVICGLSDCTIFFSTLSHKRYYFPGKKSY